VAGRVRASATLRLKTRLLAAPNRYLAAGSTAGSCLLERRYAKGAEVRERAHA
jgi:hypothetical protein